MDWKDELRNAENSKRQAAVSIENIPILINEKMELVERLGNEFVSALGWLKCERESGESFRYITLLKEQSGSCWSWSGVDNSGIHFSFHKVEEVRKAIKRYGKPPDRFLEVGISTFGFLNKLETSLSVYDVNEEKIKSVLTKFLEASIDRKK